MVFKFILYSKILPALSLTVASFSFKTLIVIKIFIITLVFSLSLSISSYANQSVEEIIKGRKAIFSENYQTAKKISIFHRALEKNFY